MSYLTPYLKTIVITSAILTTMLGCTSGGDKKFSETEQTLLPLTQQSITCITDINGNARSEFEISSGTTAFALTAFAHNDATLSFSELRGPSNQAILNADDIANNTGQEKYNSAPITLNYPSTPNLIASIPSGRYSVVISAKKGSKFIAGQIITLSLVTKSDSGNFLGNAKVNINLILAGPVSGDKNNLDSIKDAFGKVQKVYSNKKINLAGQVVFRPDLPATLPNPTDTKNSAIYESISNEYYQAINLIFAVQVEKLSFPDNEYAQAGFTPIPSTPSIRSAVAFSVDDLSGTDGEFDLNRGDEDQARQVYDNETLHMANVIAHELGHALGLKNSVTLRGQDATDSDLLSDTPSCINRISCEALRSANENIMFPYSLRRKQTSSAFWSRDVISDQQAIIIKQNVMVNIE